MKNRERSIAPILYDIKNPKIDLRIHILSSGMPHTVVGHCALDLWPQFLKNHIHNISPKLFDVVISNFVCACIFMLGIVAYYFRVTVALTSDLSCIKLCMEHKFYII